MFKVHCLKFLFKLANIARSYEENKTVPFVRSQCSV